MAIGILLMVVMAVTLAVTAGQQHAFEAQQRIAAVIAAEEKMGFLSTQAYSDLMGWNGHDESPGSIVAMDGSAAPGSFDQIGRRVQIHQDLINLPGSDVRVLGRHLRVQVYDRTGEVLVELERFIPEPAGG